MGVRAQGYIAGSEAEFRIALSVDGDILQVSGMMAVGALESVLLAFGIKMSSRRLEVRTIALGVLMKVDAMLARRQIVKANIYPNGVPLLLPYQDGHAHALALGVFQFDYGLGRAHGGAKNQKKR